MNATKLIVYAPGANADGSGKSYVVFDKADNSSAALPSTVRQQMTMLVFQLAVQGMSMAMERLT